MQPYLFIFLYKDGLLARLAHDLRLSMECFRVELAAGRLQVTCDLHSLRVDGVMRRGRLDADVLSRRDCEEILERTWTDVLQVTQFPQARLVAEIQPGPPPALAGRLLLKGREEAVDLSLQGPGADAAAQMVARAQLSLSRWGIAPFRALGGALRLQDRVDVEAGIPWHGKPRRPAEWPEACGRWEVQGGSGPALSPVEAQK